MFRDNKRLSFRMRRLIRHLRRTRHASVQDMTLHELHRGIRRSHGLKPPGAPDIASHGIYRPLSRRAKHLLTRLRKARLWNVKKHLLAEIQREMNRSRRLAERIGRSRAVRGAAAAGRAAGRGLRAAGRGARAAGRGARRAWITARPHVNRIQERMLTRAERRQAEREAGRRRPPLGTRARRRSREAARSLRDRVRSRRLARAPQGRPQRVPQPVRSPSARVPRAPRPARARTARPRRPRMRAVR